MFDLFLIFGPQDLTDWWAAIDPILDDPLVLTIIGAILAAIGLPAGLGIKNRQDKAKQKLNNGEKN